ncbi:hypothetical protein [Fundicoccus culcitae]|uniref:DUF624 domain-containing protein n=1 Tax=Fundicoccus culcitae TaxID=2969821 RepID=A0ABY5P8R3_9LACT|nr:hypothetical protein [Fundicoccus culcitae]UUX35136.1 hypothetical protein NRE15_05710 [Fundicoccus culcitae]
MMEFNNRNKMIEYVYILSDYFIKLLLTNLLFCLFSIFIITIPSAISGLYSNCNKIYKKEDFSVISNFSSESFSNFKMKIKVSCIAFIATIIFIYDLTYLALIDEVLSVLGLTILLSILIFKNYFELTLFFQINKKYHSIKDLLRNSFKLITWNVKLFSFTILIDLLIIFISLLSSNIRYLILFLSVFVLIAIYGVVKTMLFNKIIFKGD